MSKPSNPLANSRRRYEKRTYTPLITADPGPNVATNAFGMAAQVRALMISDDELSQLTRRLSGNGGSSAVDAMRRLATAVSAGGVLTAANDLAGVSTDELRTVADALAGIRAQAVDTLAGGLRELDQQFTTDATITGSPAGRSSGFDRPEPPPSYPPTMSGGPVPGNLSAAMTGEHHIETATAVAELPSQSRLVDLHLPSGIAASGGLGAQVALASLARMQPAGGTADRLLSAAVGPRLAQRAGQVLAWAVDAQPERAQPLLDQATQYVSVAADPATTVVQAISHLTRLRLLTQLFSESLTQRPLQPIGLLHLERLEMTPLDVERGELAYSLPLAPDEKVTLAHREWSVREEQFTEFIEDYLQNFSEQGVAQTNDIAISTSAQTSHTDALSMSQPVAAANGVHVTSAVDTTAPGTSTVNDATTREETKAQSRTVTANASTRTMKDHKVSFTVTTVSGMEDFTAHLIENKHDDMSMRIDYFKRVRNWQTELYRYGVRLTYDVVLPDPGARLRERERLLQQYTEELATEFRLELLPSQVQVSNWEQLADDFGVVLPPPPDQVQQIQVSTVPPLNYTTPYDINTGPDKKTWEETHRLTSLAITVPGGYQLDNLNVHGVMSTWVTFTPQWITAYAGQSVQSVSADTSGYCNLDWNLNSSQVPAEGTISVVFRMRGVESGTLQLTATVVPTESTMEAWRLACWSIIRDSATANATQHRSYLRDRAAGLRKDIAADDAVRLRRMEREAIMRCVLEWLFPGFEDASSILASLPSPGYLDPGTWQQVMEYGEYIKFVQNAIDWDNVIVFLYPYFWDTIWHEHEKLWLEHPDPVHREFLRAGAARVIIAIKPGFEDDVVALLDQGQLGNLGDQSRFASAISDVRAANAAYGATAKGGPPTEDPQEPGVLLGSWTDHTPTSALDIEVTVKAVTVG